MNRQTKWWISTLFFIGVMPMGVALSSPIDLSDQPSQAAPKDAVLQHWDTYISPYNYPLTGSDLYKEYQYQVTPEFSYISYGEPSVSMKERGPFYGLYGAYNWRPEDARAWPINVLHVDTNFSFGSINYKSPDAQVSDLKDYMIEPRLWLGYDFSLFDFTRLTPYGGLGYRFLFDHLGEASDIGGYGRASEYIYAPIGFEIVNQSVRGWQLGLNGEYDILIQGWQTSYLSNINGEFPNLTNKQTKGFGIRGSLDIVKKMEHIDILISPYIHYWKIQQSKTSSAINTSSGIGFVGYEPANNSTEIGVKLGVQF